MTANIKQGTHPVRNAYQMKVPASSSSSHGCVLEDEKWCCKMAEERPEVALSKRTWYLMTFPYLFLLGSPFDPASEHSSRIWPGMLLACCADASNLGRVCTTL